MIDTSHHEIWHLLLNRTLHPAEERRIYLLVIQAASATLITLTQYQAIQIIAAYASNEIQAFAGADL